MGRNKKRVSLNTQDDAAPSVQPGDHCDNNGRDDAQASGGVHDRLVGNKSHNDNLGVFSERTEAHPPNGFQTHSIESPLHRPEKPRPRFLRNLLEAEGVDLSSTATSGLPSTPAETTGNEDLNLANSSRPRSQSVPLKQHIRKGHGRSASLEIIINAVAEKDMPAHRKLRRLGLVYQDFRDHPEDYDDFEFSKMRDYVTEIARGSKEKIYLEGDYNDEEADFEEEVIGGSDSEGIIDVDFEKPLKLHMNDDTEKETSEAEGDGEEQKGESSGRRRKPRGKGKAKELGVETPAQKGEKVDKPAVKRRKRATKSEQQEEDAKHGTKDEMVPTPPKKRSRGGKSGTTPVRSEKVAGSRRTRGRGRGSKRGTTSRPVFVVEESIVEEPRVELLETAPSGKEGDFDTNGDETTQGADQSVTTATSSRGGRGSRGGKRGARRTRASARRTRGGRRGGGVVSTRPEPGSDTVQPIEPQESSNRFSPEMEAAVDYFAGDAHPHAGRNSGIKFPHHAKQQVIINGAVINGNDGSYIRDLSPNLVNKHDYFPVNPFFAGGSNEFSNPRGGMSVGNNRVNIHSNGFDTESQGQHLQFGGPNFNIMPGDDFGNVGVYAQFPSTSNYTLPSFNTFQHAPPPGDNFGEGSSRSIERDLDREREELDTYAKNAVAEAAASADEAWSNDALYMPDDGPSAFMNLNSAMADDDETPNSTIYFHNELHRQTFRGWAQDSSLSGDTVSSKGQARGSNETESYIGLGGIFVADPYLSGMQQQDQVGEYLGNPSKSRPISVVETYCQGNNILEPNILINIPEDLEQGQGTDNAGKN